MASMTAMLCTDVQKLTQCQKQTTQCKAKQSKAKQSKAQEALLLLGF
jgi:hypothetical protein